MALRLPAFDERIDYILAEDRASELPTVFELRRLTGAEQTQVAALTPISDASVMLEVAAIHARARAEKREPTAEEIARIEEIIPMDAAFLEKRMRQQRLAASLGVVGIRHMLDAQGKPSTLSGAEFAEKCPPRWVAEIGDEVMRLSQLPDDTRKNSSAPPAPGD